MHAYCCSLDSDNQIKLSSADEFRWINQNEFDDFAFPKANKVVIQNLVGTS